MEHREPRHSSPRLQSLSKGLPPSSEEDEPWHMGCSLPQGTRRDFFPHLAVLRRANRSHLTMAWKTPLAALISSCY